jgi:hypothetical protein
MTLREQTGFVSKPSEGLPDTLIPSNAGPAGSVPSPVAVPQRNPGSAAEDQQQDGENPDRSGNGKEDCTFPQPKLRLQIHDLDHPGASKFLGAVNPATVLSAAVDNVLRLLYRSPSDRHTTVPPTRSVTLILRDMDGVAYTTGVGTLVTCSILS